MTADEVRIELEIIACERHLQIVNYIKSQCPIYISAEDCVQYAYMEAIAQAEKIHDAHKLISWIVTVAKRHAWKEARWYKCQLKYATDPSVCDTEKLWQRVELKETLQQASERWPIYYHSILRMRYKQEKSFLEISDELGIAYGTVRNAHFRMKQDLKDQLFG